MSKLTDRERKVVMKLIDAWNAFRDLPEVHADDTTEFRHGIHRLQEKVLARPTRRDFDKE
jgi:hypothetical protein